MSKRPGPSRPSDTRPPKRDPRPPFDTEPSKPTPKKYADAQTWAAEIAATLPPFTAAEAAAVGQLAAVLDARRLRTAEPAWAA